MGLAELRADGRLNRDRVLRAELPDVDTEWCKREFADNVWPFLEELVRCVQEDVVEEVRDLGEAIDEIIEREHSMLHPELAAMIIGVFEAGKLVCVELEKAIADSEDELAKKRITELMHAYLQGAEIVSERVAEVTLEEDEVGAAAEDEVPEDAQEDEQQPLAPPEDAPIAEEDEVVDDGN
jgi:hypothetical protein